MTDVSVPDFNFTEALNMTDELLYQIRMKRKKRTIKVCVIYLDVGITWLNDWTRMSRCIDGSKKWMDTLEKFCIWKVVLVPMSAKVVIERNLQHFAVTPVLMGGVYAANV